ncbi:hypothetical protein HOF78_01255 [Candidatus Woesearchaeota archaeon]|jgi:hypothetical protein|nr:hypothetical protein [Candidatus Woesearchaeota archaeon]MBT6044989.1 hypothetical protein [Candidatus Woesearchaeota archaeon]
MPQRIIPRKGLLLKATRSNKRFLSAMDHGISETSLKDIYPVLDLDEVLAFEAASWSKRNRGDFGDFEGNFHDMFYRVTKEGLDWLDEIRSTDFSLSDKDQYQQGRLNPFHGEDLRDRLRMFDEESIAPLTERLQTGTFEYVSEAQHGWIRRHRSAGNKPLKIMGGQMPARFSGANPKRITGAYASHSAEILRKYPTEHVSFIPKETLVEQRLF